MRLARVLGAIGRVLITVGTLILLFVAYQLWGTGIREAQAQNELETEFEERLDEFEASIETTTTRCRTRRPRPPRRRFPRRRRPNGEGVAVIKVPNIGVEKVVVEGVTL